MNKEEQQDVESRILDAAKQVFIRKGYEAATMGDIAAEAGMGRTSLHYYFRTKDMLFDAIFGQLLNALLPNVALVVEEGTDYRSKLKKIIHLYITILRKNPLFPLFVVNELNRDPEHLFRTILKDPKRLEPILRLQKLILSEMEAGSIRKMPFIDLVANVISLLAFPFLMRNPLIKMFPQEGESHIERFFDRREEVVYDMIIRFIAPDNNETK